jgi:aminoglycoside 6'-N-acetyltransferase I
MRIRQVAPEDVEAWCAMRAALWPDAHAEELRAEARSHLAEQGPLALVLLAEEAPGEALGMLELSLRSYAEGCSTAPAPYIEAWYVLPQARRRGVGRALLAAAERWAGARGHREIASDTLLDNIGEEAHLALGFTEVERAIHFRKDLSAPPATSASTLEEA